MVKEINNKEINNTETNNNKSLSINDLAKQTNQDATKIVKSVNDVVSYMLNVSLSYTPTNNSDIKIEDSKIKIENEDWGNLSDDEDNTQPNSTSSTSNNDEINLSLSSDGKLKSEPIALTTKNINITHQNNSSTVTSSDSLQMKTSNSDSGISSNSSSSSNVKNNNRIIINHPTDESNFFDKTLNLCLITNNLFNKFSSLIRQDETIKKYFDKFVAHSLTQLETEIEEQKKNIRYKKTEQQGLWGIQFVAKKRVEKELSDLNKNQQKLEQISKEIQEKWQRENIQPSNRTVTETVTEIGGIQTNTTLKELKLFMVLASKLAQHESSLEFRNKLDEVKKYFDSFKQLLSTQLTSKQDEFKTNDEQISTKKNAIQDIEKKYSWFKGANVDDNNNIEKIKSELTQLNSEQTRLTNEIKRLSEQDKDLLEITGQMGFYRASDSDVLLHEINNCFSTKFNTLDEFINANQDELESLAKETYKNENVKNNLSLVEKKVQNIEAGIKQIKLRQESKNEQEKMLLAKVGQLKKYLSLLLNIKGTEITKKKEEIKNQRLGLPNNIITTILDPLEKIKINQAWKKLKTEKEQLVDEHKSLRQQIEKLELIELQIRYHILLDNEVLSSEIDQCFVQLNDNQLLDNAKNKLFGNDDVKLKLKNIDQVIKKINTVVEKINDEKNTIANPKNEELKTILIEKRKPIIGLQIKETAELLKSNLEEINNKKTAITNKKKQLNNLNIWNFRAKKSIPKELKKLKLEKNELEEERKALEKEQQSCVKKYEENNTKVTSADLDNNALNKISHNATSIMKKLQENAQLEKAQKELDEKNLRKKEIPEKNISYYIATVVNSIKNRFHSLQQTWRNFALVKWFNAPKKSQEHENNQIKIEIPKEKKITGIATVVNSIKNRFYSLQQAWHDSALVKGVDALRENNQGKKEVSKENNLADVTAIYNSAENNFYLPRKAWLNSRWGKWFNPSLDRIHNELNEEVDSDLDQLSYLIKEKHALENVWFGKKWWNGTSLGVLNQAISQSIEQLAEDHKHKEDHKNKEEYLLLLKLCEEYSKNKNDVVFGWITNLKQSLASENEESIVKQRENILTAVYSDASLNHLRKSILTIYSQDAVNKILVKTGKDALFKEIDGVNKTYYQSPEKLSYNDIELIKNLTPKDIKLITHLTPFDTKARDVLEKNNIPLCDGLLALQPAALELIKALTPSKLELIKQLGNSEIDLINQYINNAQEIQRLRQQLKSRNIPLVIEQFNALSSFNFNQINSNLKVDLNVDDINFVRDIVNQSQKLMSNNYRLFEQINSGLKLKLNVSNIEFIYQLVTENKVSVELIKQINPDQNFFDLIKRLTPVSYNLTEEEKLRAVSIYTHSQIKKYAAEGVEQVLINNVPTIFKSNLSNLSQLSPAAWNFVRGCSEKIDLAQIAKLAASVKSIEQRKNSLLATLSKLPAESRKQEIDNILFEKNNAEFNSLGITFESLLTTFQGNPAVQHEIVEVKLNHLLKEKQWEELNDQLTFLEGKAIAVDLTKECRQYIFKKIKQKIFSKDDSGLLFSKYEDTLIENKFILGEAEFKLTAEQLSELNKAIEQHDLEIFEGSLSITINEKLKATEKNFKVLTSINLLNKKEREEIKKQTCEKYHLSFNEFIKNGKIENIVRPDEFNVLFLGKLSECIVQQQKYKKEDEFDSWLIDSNSKLHDLEDEKLKQQIMSNPKLIKLVNTSQDRIENRTLLQNGKKELADMYADGEISYTEEEISEISEINISNISIDTLNPLDDNVVSTPERKNQNINNINIEKQSPQKEKNPNTWFNSSANKTNNVDHDADKIIINTITKLDPKDVKQGLHNISFSIKGLTYKEIPGDDHCLYGAVCEYKKDFDDQTPKKTYIRGIVANYIRTHENEFRDAVVNGVDKYVTGIEGSEWADEIEINVLMKILEQPIVIIGNDAKIRNMDAINQYQHKEPIFIYYNGRNHYDVFTVQDDYRAKDILDNLKFISLNKNLNESLNESLNPIKFKPN